MPREPNRRALRWVPEIVQQEPTVGATTSVNDRCSIIPVHRLIEQRHGASSAIALRFRDEECTYAQLNAGANRLARYLLSRGARAESRILVCLEPAVAIEIALLAILKAGAVYVPLEPTYPAARMRFILEDTQPTLVLTSDSLAGKLPLVGFERFLMDAEASHLDRFSAENLDSPIAPEQVAYMFYTSGSTGKPKCVMASHANLIHYIESAERRYGFTQRDVMPAIARFSFSISLFELLTPLVAGGTVLLLERNSVVDPAQLSEILQKVTFFHAGPSLLRVVLAYIRHRYTEFSSFSRVRHASSGGDVVPPELLESMKDIFPSAEVFVIYGCSEISCMGCTYPVSRQRTISRTLVGKPFENIAVRLQDAQGACVAVGEIGEICFAGAGVVKGYWNRAELTAEKFIDADGGRLYRTGDLGRFNQGGELEFIGRQDFQVQIRGMRVELEEVEYALRTAPGVDAGVVMAWTDAAGEKRLVAYLVFQSGQGSNTEVVRKHMDAHLPDYLLPSLYVTLESMPLNHNMKIDRKALPTPWPLNQATDAPPVPPIPQTATETQVLAIIRELLAIQEVQLDDNFLDLGGSSILVMCLILEVERRFHVTFDGTQLGRQSLRELAASIDRALRIAMVHDSYTRQVASDGTRPNHSALDNRELLKHSESDAVRGAAFIADLGRYVRNQELNFRTSARLIRENYGLQALLGYRLGRFLRSAHGKPHLWALLPFGWPLYCLVSCYVRLAFDIRLYLSADIGPGLYIGHFGGISLENCRLGAQCSISQSVQIGPKAEGVGPVIGNRVWIGAHATIIGAYHVASGSTVSAGTAVQGDIPEHALYMGIPPRIVMRYYDNSPILAI